MITCQIIAYGRLMLQNVYFSYNSVLNFSGCFTYILLKYLPSPQINTVPTSSWLLLLSRINRSHFIGHQFEQVELDYYSSCLVYHQVWISSNFWFCNILLGLVLVVFPQFFLVRQIFNTRPGKPIDSRIRNRIQDQYSLYQC